MSDEERLSREAFYGNLIWVLDGKPFKSVTQGLADLSLIPQWAEAGDRRAGAAASPLRR